MIDMQRYGGKRAYLTHLVARTRNMLGAYSQLEAVQWKSIKRLVFICKGNICRSPYGEFRARTLGMAAVSFGLDTVDGAEANPDAVKNAIERELDLSAHRSSRLHSSALQHGDLVLLFEPEHLAAYHRICGDSPATVTLLGLWVKPNRPHIADPYGRSDRYFQECFSIIDSGVRNIHERRRD